jgi:hypothetical protein
VLGATKRVLLDIPGLRGFSAGCLLAALHIRAGALGFLWHQPVDDMRSSILPFDTFVRDKSEHFGWPVKHQDRFDMSFQP